CSWDEYTNYLRVAITVGEGMFGWRLGIGGRRESANDVYILDNDLKITGALQNLGLEERIYSARFIEDKGYLVTFRQIDPFFVLDLSDPKNPQLKGELKIPGYSSYLHPITKDKILGVGKEGSKVKISLFDVESPENPTEVSKYTLDEYWSDILNTHHAFLLDKKHQIFFLPGGKGGYVFSYQDNQLKLIKAVSNIRARRAIYLNDYLYIIGDDKLVVLNEVDWERVNEVEF
ncbi:MAG: beta-propeller domain-containing protein, partial [Candidatus Paceibacterales bacterium]